MEQADMEKSEVLQGFAEIVAESLHVDVQQVTPDAYLTDLGAESLDLVEIAIHCEEKFNISLPEKNIFQTASEIFGPGVLEKDGVLTETGKGLLRARMPELDPKLLSGDVTVKDLGHSFQQVSAWVRLIQGLMEFTPKTCPQCGAELRTSVALRMKCKQCGAETPIPSGDELNRKWVQQYCEQEHFPIPNSQPAEKAVGHSPTSQLA